MNKEILINRIARDLKAQGLIGEDYVENVKFFIGLAWTAGWEERNKEWSDHRSIPVQQCNYRGELIHKYNNIIIAARLSKYSRNTIYTAIKSGEPTRRGHIFKYAENGKGTD